MDPYNHIETESKWKKFWIDNQIFKTPSLDKSDKKKYILFAFAYPSGSGLHVGHCKPYTAVDIVARYYNLKGNKVLNPTGWDSFGLPAENYAIKSGVHPHKKTEESIKYYVDQVKNLGLSTDWDREIATHRPEYYKWTQWLFSQLYKKGLAYKKEAMVNWDPIDQTVLANEQVLPDGTSERSGGVVEQKYMSQWFFKITDYAERLLDDLDGLDWPESTKQMQRNWIGKSKGALVKFNLLKPTSETDHIEVFTTRIDTIFTGTFLLLAPENSLVKKITTPENIEQVENYLEITKKKSKLERTDLNKNWTACFTGSYAINPSNNEKIPIWIADFVLEDYGTGAVFGNAHDDRDYYLGKKYNIPLKTCLIPDDDTDSEKVKNLEICYTGLGTLFNSKQFNGLNSIQAKEKILDWGIENGWAKAKINYKLRDWLISRQRYWGSPIPIYYDEHGVEQLVPYEDLPVLLPYDVEFKPTGKSPLYDHKEFHESAQKYGKHVTREVDTMDTFVCSSWYFLRFMDPHNDKEFASIQDMKKWGPVDEYIIGAEHTVLHLLYARFFTKFLFDEGYIDFQEPFTKMRHPGLLLGPDNRKMSKRWGNVVNPTDVCKTFGADTLRMYEMFMGPFKDGNPWNENTIKGVRKFIDRVYKLQNNTTDQKNQNVEIELNKMIKKVDEDIQNYSFNTAVSAFMIFINVCEKEKSITPDQFKKFIICLSPFAPFICEEIYSNLEIKNKKKSIYFETYPDFDEKLLISDEVIIVIQINGKVRGKINVPTDTEDEIVLALAKEKVKTWLLEKTIKFEKVIKNKMVTIAI